MARLLTILKATAHAAGRGSRSLLSLRSNNIVYAGMVMLLLKDPGAAAFFVVLALVVLFFPSSSDPMASVPRERLALWPLSAPERLGLRLLSPLLNPLVWIILAAIIWKRLDWGIWALVAVLFAGGFIASSYRMPNVWVPRIPAGGLTQIVRKDLRQSLTALDFYCALLIALPCLYFRLIGKLPPDARTVVTGLLIVIMSTIPLTLFGLDGESGMSRYALWPIPGWKVLAAKAVAFLLLMLLVTLPLSPIGGLAGGLVALAVGQFASVRRIASQARWRFRAGSPMGYKLSALGFSLAEMLLAILGLVLVARYGAWWLGACVAIYAGSLWFCGRDWDTRVGMA